VLGPLLVEGWRQAPQNGVGLVIGFYATMVLTLTGIITLFAGTRSFGPRAGRVLVAISALALAAFGIWQLWTAGHTFLLRQP
jgi:threonine/homoserine/homoserine lactone efflux protein